MLVDIKSRLDDPSIQKLLAFAMFPDPDRMLNTLNRYRSEEQRHILGYVLDDQVIGVIGYQMEADHTLMILHIAITPDERGHGFGRGIILETIEREHPKLVAAETDEETVDFYRNIGFAVQSLGEQYPGVERFKCMFETDF